MGPSWTEQWTGWKYVSEEQQRRNAVKNELEKILYNDPVCKTCFIFLLKLSEGKNI